MYEDNLVFKVKVASLGKLDKNGERLSDDLVFFYSDYVPVSIDFRAHEDVYGYAENFEKVDDSLWADIVLYKDRLDDAMLNAIKHLKPCLGGSTLVRTDAEIQKIYIKQLGLSVDNADSDIKSIKEQVNGK